MDAALQVVSIPVTDQTRAKEFYVDSLGFRLLVDSPMEDGTRWVQVAPPRGEASITLVTWFPTMPPGSARGMVLGCGDLEQAVDEYGQRGVEFSGPIQEAPWGRFAEFCDPDGNGWILTKDGAPN